MRRSLLNCLASLLVVIILGLVLVPAQLVLPARADCREVPYGLEDGGDPDGLDGVMAITYKTDALTYPCEARSQSYASSSNSLISQCSASRADCAAIRVKSGGKESVIGFWGSIASLVFAF